MKILVVDDEILNCKLLQSLLKGHGECSIAMSGDSAIQLFEESLKNQEFYNLVCLDIMMPKKDGHEVLRAMRTLEKSYAVPADKRSHIIMVTALGEQENKTKAFYEECNGYLTKPVEQTLLFEMLSKMNLLNNTDG